MGGNLESHLRILPISLTQDLGRPGNLHSSLLEIPELWSKKSGCPDRPHGEATWGGEKPWNYMEWEAPRCLSPAVQPSLLKCQMHKWTLLDIPAQLCPLKSAAPADIMWGRRTTQLSPVNPLREVNYSTCQTLLVLGGNMVLPIVFLGSWQTCLLCGSSPQQSLCCGGWCHHWGMCLVTSLVPSYYLQRHGGWVGKLLEGKARDLDSSINCYPTVWS